ncbi:MAG: hypothetical protein IPM64_10275 [Phycisphaerales bacterium]|nr:hypothetical protein [Phycisphaerales bacterium]
MVASEPGRPGCTGGRAAAGQTRFECDAEFLMEHVGTQTFHAIYHPKLFGVRLPIAFEVSEHPQATVDVTQPLRDAEFSGLGFLSAAPYGYAGNASSSAYAVSADGSVVVGLSANAAGQGEAIRWSNVAMVGLGFLSAAPNGHASQAYSYATGVSADGSVIVGGSYDAAGRPEAFRWSNGAMVGLSFLSAAPNGHASQATSHATDVSADGSVVVGYSRNAAAREEAFRWSNGAMIGLGFLSAAPGGYAHQARSFASGISADGSVIVGGSYDAAGRPEAFRWSNGAMVGLSFLSAAPGGHAYNAWSIATDVSADGSVVVGQSRNTAGAYEAFRWSNGAMVGLGFLSAAPNGHAPSATSAVNAVSADGSVGATMPRAGRRPSAGRMAKWSASGSFPERRKAMPAVSPPTDASSSAVPAARPSSGPPSTACGRSRMS